MLERYTGEYSQIFGMKLYGFLQPLYDIHLRSKLVADIAGTGNIHQVYVFLAIAILIVIIACINFVNLSTARSTHRAMEVGVRKVFGAYRRHIVSP